MKILSSKPQVVFLYQGVCSCLPRVKSYWSLSRQTFHVLLRSYRQESLVSDASSIRIPLSILAGTSSMPGREVDLSTTALSADQSWHPTSIRGTIVDGIKNYSEMISKASFDQSNPENGYRHGQHVFDERRYRSFCIESSL